MWFKQGQRLIHLNLNDAKEIICSKNTKSIRLIYEKSYFDIGFSTHKAKDDMFQTILGYINNSEAVYDLDIAGE